MLIEVIYIGLLIFGNSFNLLYMLGIFWIFFGSSLWVYYFGLEFQWMLLLIMVIMESGIWRGLVNYLMMNAVLSIILLNGIIISSVFVFIFGCFGKVGYFPFIIVLGYQYYSSSYIWMIYDLVNKWGYFGIILLLVIMINIFIDDFIEWIILLNFLLIIFYIKYLLSIKHLILISSLQLFLLILSGLYNESVLFSVYLLMGYYLVVYFYLILLVIY